MDQVVENNEIRHTFLLSQLLDLHYERILWNMDTIECKGS